MESIVRVIFFLRMIVSKSTGNDGRCKSRARLGIGLARVKSLAALELRSKRETGA